MLSASHHELRSDWQFDNPANLSRYDRFQELKAELRTSIPETWS